MPRCSFPEADINWFSNFSIHKRLSMRSCTTHTLRASRTIAIPGYAAQVSVRAGSVIAHLASLNRVGPKQPFAHPRPCRIAARQPGFRCKAAIIAQQLHFTRLVLSDAPNQRKLNQSHYQQAMRNRSVEHRCVFDDARKHCGQKLCSVNMLYDFVEILC